MHASAGVSDQRPASARQQRPKKQRNPAPHNNDDKQTDNNTPTTLPGASHANRATVDGVRIGADLLSRPPPVQKNIGHLVGRTLIPFYTAAGVENDTHDIAHNAKLNFSVDDDRRGHDTQVRAFVDGYFVNQGSLAPTPTQPQPASATPATTQNNQQQQQKPKKRDNKQNNKQQPQQQPQQPQPQSQQPQQPRAKERKPKSQPQQPQSSTSAAPTPARLYAGAAFLASPSPLQVPLPKFLTATKPPSSPGSARRTAAAAAAAPPATTANTNGHATPHGHVHDAHASQSIMNLLRVGPNATPASPKLIVRESSQEKRNPLLAHPPSPNAAAAAAYGSAMAAQPTLLAPSQPIPHLPAYGMPPHATQTSHVPHPHHSVPHAHAHYGYAAPTQTPPFAPSHQPTYTAPVQQPSYYNTAYSHPASAPTSSGGSASAVPLISAVHSRYDRPNVAANHGYAPYQPNYGQPMAYHQPY